MEREPGGKTSRTIAAIAFASPNKERWIAAAHAEGVHVYGWRSSGAGLAMTMGWQPLDRFLASLAMSRGSRHRDRRHRDVVIGTALSRIRVAHAPSPECVRAKGL